MATSSAYTATTTILDLPAELIEHICCSDSLKLIDVFNLALSNSKLNNSLFHERNPCLWKAKFIQKYGLLDNDEYEVVFDEQNTWKDEIMLRMSLNKAVPAEIIKMPCNYMKLKNVPYHLYPFSQYLNSKNEGHRYYILSAIAAYYEQLQKNIIYEDTFLSLTTIPYDYSSENFDRLYMAHTFLIYSCQVYFGYKLSNFLSLPPAEQIVERWWLPTGYRAYCDINKSLNNIAIDVCNRIRSTNPVHPMFEHENCLKQVVERGKFNLEHDLFDETITMYILDNIRQIIFSEDQIVCHCNENLDCFFLLKVMDQGKGSVFILCVIFQSVARRLGVKVCLTATSVHNFVSWSSSWPGNKIHKNPTCYLVDIAGGGIMRKATQQYIENSILDLFWTFSETMANSVFNSMVIYKFVLDFQKLLRPDDSEFEFKCQKFHQYNGCCRCPLLRNPSNPYAPNHVDEKNIMYMNHEEIFPLVPKTRKIHNPTFSVGMMIDEFGAHGAYERVLMKCGVVVGWTIVPSKNNITIYHVLISPLYTFATQLNPVIDTMWEDRSEKLQRQLRPGVLHCSNLGKFFTHFSPELRAFVPIKDLAQL